jgi:hypothetical protein
MSDLSVFGYDFVGNVDEEAIVFKDTLISELGGEDSAIKAIKAQRDVFNKYGEWPCKEATKEEIDIYEKVAKAESVAWDEAFKDWQVKPGDRGEHFEYYF